MKNKLSFVGTVFAVVLILVLGVYLVQGGLFSGVLAQRTAETQTTTTTVDVTRTILVVGEGVVSIQPDRAQATIGVETTGATVREATQESAEIMEALLAALREQGVSERDIQTSGFSVWTERTGRPVEMPGSTGEDAVIYRVTNTVRVTVVDLSKLSAILDAAIDSGANAIYGINFSIADPSTIETQARIKAVADAKAKAEELADLAGVRVGAVVSVSEVIGAGVFPAMREAAVGMGGAVGPMSPGEMDYTVQLQVVYSIR
jgi:uncharacterized protein